MWYNDAEQYLLWVIIIACGWFLVLKRNKAKPRWRAVFLLIIGFGAGLYIGIETRACLQLGGPRQPERIGIKRGTPFYNATRSCGRDFQISS